MIILWQLAIVAPAPSCWKPAAGATQRWVINATNVSPLRYWAFVVAVYVTGWYSTLTMGDIQERFWA